MACASQQRSAASPTVRSANCFATIIKPAVRSAHWSATPRSFSVLLSSMAPIPRPFAVHCAAMETAARLVRLAPLSTCSWRASHETQSRAQGSGDLGLAARDGLVMSERPWMPFYVNDFQIDTTGLTADERGVYITMVCLAWRSGDGSVSGDMEELKTVLQNIIADFHGLTFNRVVPKLLDRYFEKRAGGRFYQPGVEKQLRIARELSEKQSRNAKERWSQDRKN